jgi:hypothetical protein
MNEPNSARRRSSRSLLALAALLACLRAGPADAHAPDTLVACYVPASGTVYRVGAAGLPSDCLAQDHTRFSWTRPSNAAGDSSGSLPAPTVARLQGRAVSTTAPDTGQVLTRMGTAWMPVRWQAGVSRHGALDGPIVDDHPQYLLSQGVCESLDGF